MLRECVFFFATVLHSLHALHISMLNTISISAYVTVSHLYMLQINVNAFVDLHLRHGSWISVNGHEHLVLGRVNM